MDFSSCSKKILLIGYNKSVKMKIYFSLCIIITQVNFIILLMLIQFPQLLRLKRIHFHQDTRASRSIFTIEMKKLGLAMFKGKNIGLDYQ